MKRIATLLVISTLLVLLPLGAADQGAGLTDELTKPPSYFEWVQEPLRPHVSGDGLLEGEASSDGRFRLSLHPDFRIGNTYFQFDMTLAGKIHGDPFAITLDFDGWKAPPKEQLNGWEYSMRLLKHYSAFIRSINCGERNDPLFIRYGKLMGVTLGDGALINGFFDLSVDLRASRPGLEARIDLSHYGLLNGGFHFLTTDLYNPSLLAWRLVVQPFGFKSQREQLQKFAVGLSYATALLPKDLERQFLVLDLSYPVYSGKHLTLNLFSDFITQTSDGLFFYPSLGLRYGIAGNTKRFMLFNIAITHPLNGIYYIDYLGSDFETRKADALEALALPLGTLRLEANYGLNIVQRQVFLRAKMASLLTGGVYHDYQFQMSLHIDKRLFNLVSLDFTYEKLYPTAIGERFFEGLFSLKNVEFKTAAIVKLKPYTIDLSLHASFDERAAARYRLSTAVRITIL